MKKFRTGISKTGRCSLYIAGVTVVVLLVVSITISFWAAKADTLQNHVRVEEESELKYYLTVKYDGKDKLGKQSSDTELSEIYSGVVDVSDQLPDGLEFVGFEATSTGMIGAAKRNDSSISCPGTVVDDTHEESVEAGVWNSDHTEFTYHGLHYNAATRTVSFKATNVQAGCDLTIGIITKTPSLNGRERMDFFNTGRVNEGGITKDSNTVHVWLGEDWVSSYDVKYAYTGDVPEGAPTKPEDQSYAEGATVSVAAKPVMEGYEFSGWETSDVTVADGKFTMPNETVSFVGTFVEKTEPTKYKVTYVVEGDVPTGYMAPKERSYEAGAAVTIDSSKKDDTIDDYIFQGWTSEDVDLTSGGFLMPEGNVTIRGSFVRQSFTVTYAFEGSVLPPGAESLLPETESYHIGDVVTLAAAPTADGYKFSGWYSDDSFEIKGDNVTIYGEWKVQAGTFAPTISMDIIDKQDVYHVGDTIEFEITVSNTADFAITDVKVLEQLDGASFEAGDGYSIDADIVATIPSLEAGASKKLKVKYVVAENETKEITNVVSMSGAKASEANYEVDTEKDYSASVVFNTEDWNETPVLSGIMTNGTIFYIVIVAVGILGITIGVVSKAKK